MARVLEEHVAQAGLGYRDVLDDKVVAAGQGHHPDQSPAALSTFDAWRLVVLTHFSLPEHSCGVRIIVTGKIVPGTPFARFFYMTICVCLSHSSGWNFGHTSTNVVFSMEITIRT